MRDMDDKPNPESYGELVTCFRQTLANMEVHLSWGKTRNYDPKMGHGGEEGTGAPWGESEPPQDHWREQWRLAGNRRKVWEEAWEDLNSMLKQKEVVVKGESKIELEARIVAEGDGWSIRDVEHHTKASGKMIRAARVQAGRSPETGKPIARGHTQVELTNREYVRHLGENGLSERQIAMITKLHKTQVHRWLEKPAKKVHISP